ncbi:MAG: hypothetical protein ABW184_15565 [Sphingobium sp.]
MKKLLRRLAVLTCAISGLFASPALAADHYLGTLQPGVGVGVGGVIGSTSNPSDRIYFSLSSIGSLGAGLVQVPPIYVANLTFYLTSVSANLYTSGGTLLATLNNTQSVTLAGLDSVDYYIDITGTAANPSLGGTYAVALLASRAAGAPGPAGLLFVGAGALAIMARRRRRQQQQAGTLVAA